jgi:hypothetical protein
MMGLGPELFVFSNFSIRFFNAIGSTLHLFQHRHADLEFADLDGTALGFQDQRNHIGLLWRYVPNSHCADDSSLGLGNIRGASIFGNASAIGRDLRAG